MVPEGPLVLGNVLARTGPAYWTLPAEYCVLRTAYYVLSIPVPDVTPFLRQSPTWAAQIRHGSEPCVSHCLLQLLQLLLLLLSHSQDILYRICSLAGSVQKVTLSRSACL
jgi:hypothetical protein